MSIKTTPLIKVRTINPKILAQIPRCYVPSPDAVPVGRVAGRTLSAGVVIFQLPNGNLETLTLDDSRKHFFKTCGSYKTADETITGLPQIFIA